jgi:glutamate 5-kinase
MIYFYRTPESPAGKFSSERRDTMHRLEGILHARNTIVIKIGTTLLTDRVKGINLQRITDIARDVSHLQSLGNRVAHVRSGAIGAGAAALQLKHRPRTIPQKQATAAIGQPILMEAYEAAFRKQDLTVAQILLTKDDFVNRIRYTNARNTLKVLFDHGVVPIINENDSVAVDEIKLGDNDNLSALVASLIEANLLIILSDVDGLYSDDPTNNSKAELIPVIDAITADIEKLAKNSRGELSTGGMITKIQAAKRCYSSGVAMVITNGSAPRALRDVVAGDFRGTLFLPGGKRLSVRERWIGLVSHAKGSVSIDDGAQEALLVKHKSLLPSGIATVHGEFKAKDTISVRNAGGAEIARGVSNYSSAELARIKGKRSGEIANVLGRPCREEAIHKDNLVIVTGRI